MIGDRKLSILCVDDNAEVVNALRVKLVRGGFDWVGSLDGADRLVERAAHDRPALIVLDADMPGKDPFLALSELAKACPDSRAVVFSGHAARSLIDQAFESGAWGYALKSDGEDALMGVLHRVAGGTFALSPEAERVFDS